MPFTFDPDVGPGNDATGAPETVSEVLTRWTAEWRTTIDPRFNPDPPQGQSQLSPEAVIANTFAAEVVSLQGYAVVVWQQLSRPTAEGKGLDNIATLLGGQGRLAGTSTTVAVAVTGVANADLNATQPSGQTVVHNPSGEFFRFPVPALLDSNGNGNFTISSLNKGPIDVAQGETDWTVNPANTNITTITASADAQLGAPRQGDVALREQIEQEIGAASSATRPALDSALLALDGVSALFVDYNNEPFPNADGVPAWELEVIIDGGTDQDIIETIAANVGITRKTFGQIQGTASTGVTYFFTRPLTIDVQFAVNITNTGAEVVLDAATRTSLESQIANAFVTRLQTYQIGRDVVPVEFNDIVNDTMPASSYVAYDVLVVVFPGVPVNLPVVIANRERARLLLANIVVSIV